MPNLMTDLGKEYADQFYKKALFSLNGEVYMYKGHLERDIVSCQKIEYSARGNPRWTDVHLRDDDFTSMDTFAWPRPGYRQWKDMKGDTLVYYFSSIRSAMRGLKPEFIELNPVPVLELVPGVSNPRDYADSAAIAKQIFQPDFTPFLEGMRKLRAGETPSFAISPDVAIALSVAKGPDVLFDVLFRERIIGEVLDDDIVRVPHRFFKKSSSNTLFEGRIVR